MKTIKLIVPGLLVCCPAVHAADTIIWGVNYGTNTPSYRDSNWVSRLPLSINTNGYLNVTPASGTNIIYADDWMSYATAWVITNATTQDYVYFRGTNAALRSNGGAATITGITVGSSVTNNINLFLFAYPPSDTTNGQPWNMPLSGPGMTNLVAVVPMSTSYKVGTNSVLYSSGLMIPFSNMDTSKNIYYVATWASSTSVTNPAGIGGDSTNFRVGFKMFRDK